MGKLAINCVETLCWVDVYLSVCVFYAMGQSYPVLLPDWSQQLVCRTWNEPSLLDGVIINNQFCYNASTRNILTRNTIVQNTVEFFSEDAMAQAIQKLYEKSKESVLQVKRALPIKPSTTSMLKTSLIFSQARRGDLLRSLHIVTNSHNPMSSTSF